MQLATQRWHPKTCDCIIVEVWDRSDPNADNHVRVSRQFLSRCRVHTALAHEDIDPIIAEEGFAENYFGIELTAAGITEQPIIEHRKGKLHAVFPSSIPNQTQAKIRAALAKGDPKGKLTLVFE
jgi:hypothetical protein